MQTFFMFSTPTVHGSRGAHISDPSIEDSALGNVIKRTFANLQLPNGINGCAKLQQRHDNPDAFDLYFYSSAESDKYSVGGTYSARDISVFERIDFESFPDSRENAQQRFQEFARRLIAGELAPAAYK
jgi:hypothetical protein